MLTGIFPVWLSRCCCCIILLLEVTTTSHRSANSCTGSRRQSGSSSSWRFWSTDVMPDGSVIYHCQLKPVVWSRITSAFLLCFVIIACRPTHPHLNHQWLSFFGHRFLAMEHSAAEGHIGAVVDCFFGNVWRPISSIVPSPCGACAFCHFRHYNRSVGLLIYFMGTVAAVLRALFLMNCRGPHAVCAERKVDEVVYRAGLNWQMPDLNSFYYCRHRSMIQVIHKPDPSLTVRLSEVLYWH